MIDPPAVSTGAAGVGPRAASVPPNPERRRADCWPFPEDDRGRPPTDARWRERVPCHQRSASPAPTLAGCRAGGDCLEPTMTVGGPVTDLDTPALLVDLDTLDSNIRRMAGTFSEQGVGWRPHTKVIKIPAIAYKLLAAGAHGVTVAKLSEAEVMAAAGITDILITGPVVGKKKAARLACLSKQAQPIAVVDCIEHIDLLDAAGQEYGVQIRTVVEVDLGMNRCGAQPGEPTVALAREIHRREGLKFEGMMAWEGHALRIKDLDEKRATVEEAVNKLLDTARQCRAADLPVNIISCGGTGTYPLSAAVHGITEIEAGGGIYGDLVYSRSFGIDHPMAMTVLSTVISRPHPNRIV